jgi:hypothetical protein
MLLRLVGLKMKYLGRFGSRQARERYYGNVAIDDEKIKVFEGWLSKDSSRNEMV